MTDDILIFGRSKEEHQKNLMAVLKRLEEHGITLNLDKCEFYRQGINYFGLRFTSEGISPTEDRCRALREAKAPTDAKSLRSFLCTVLFSARFMKDVCTVADPLWNLLKDGVQWEWTEIHQRAFEELKSLISTKCMAYFNLQWATELVVDASPVGLGAVLCQFNPEDSKERSIVCFASRSLSEVQRRYSQAEKEALAIVWGCEKFWLYLIGHRFKVITDNRAVKLIFSGNTKARPPPRIERMALRMQQFDVEYEHRPGKWNVADYYSRHPGRSSASAYLEELKMEAYINAIVCDSLPPAITLKEMAVATREDLELQGLTKAVASGGVKVPVELRKYSKVLNEISVTENGIVLRGSRIVVPEKLRSRVLKLAHGGHQGISKTKALIRSRVWFPGIDNMVERMVKLCRECQANSDRQTFEPLRPSKMPDQPWKEVSGDMFGPMDDGSYWFVNHCDHSRWAQVDRITSVAEDQVEKPLNDLFAIFGPPDVYKTDNGSPFQSWRFKQFAEKWGFKHRRITPE